MNTECDLLVSWAQSIFPLFKSLCFVDQICMIESNFIELIIMNFTWRSFAGSSGNSNEILFIMNQDLVINESLSVELEMKDIFDQILSLVNEIRRMNISLEEFLCLKGIVLLMTNDRKIKNIDEMRNKCFEALHLASAFSNNNNDDSLHLSASPRLNNQCRQESLILLLSNIKELSVQFTTKLGIIYVTNGNIKISNHLYQILIKQSHFKFMADLFKRNEVTTKTSSNEIL
jgi:hypothetical protein